MVRTALAAILLAGVAGASTLPDAPVTTRDIVFVSAGFAAASLDAWTTQRNLAHGCVEANPLVGATPSPARLWGFEMGMTAGQEFLAWEFKRHGHAKIAGVIAGSVAGAHLAAAGHNLSVRCP